MWSEIELRCGVVGCYFILTLLVYHAGGANKDRVGTEQAGNTWSNLGRACRYRCCESTDIVLNDLRLVRKLHMQQHLKTTGLTHLESGLVQVSTVTSAEVQ